MRHRARKISEPDPTRYPNSSEAEQRSVCHGKEYEHCTQNKTHQSHVVGPVSADIYQFPIVRVIRNHIVKLSLPFR